MKAPRLVLSAVSFAAAMTAVMLWPAGGGTKAGGAGGGGDSLKNGASAAGGSGQAPAAASGQETEKSAASGSAAGPGSPSAGPAPTMDQVFQAAGLDRMLLMARFIQTATPAELEAAIDRDQREDGGGGETFSDQLWLRWVELDRDAALKHQPSGTVWWALAKVDPAAALEKAGKAGRAELGAVIFSIAQGDPARARQLLREHPEVDPQRVNNGIVEGLEHQDQASAVTFALENGAYSLEAKFNVWMARDPEAAEAWVKGIADPVKRRAMEDLVLDRRIAADPAAGLEEARRLPAGRRRLDKTVEAIASLAGRDAAAAQAAAEAMPTPVSRQKALEGISQALISSDPAAAIRLMTGLDWKMQATARESEWVYAAADGQQRSSSYSHALGGENLVSQLMATAPRDTAEALAALPADSGAPMAKAVQAWAGREPEAASAWLKDLPAGPVRDRGIDGLTEWLVSGSPEPDCAAAMAWAESASPEIRDTLFARTLAAWRERDPAAAAAAVAALPEEQKTRMLDLLK